VKKDEKEIPTKKKAVMTQGCLGEDDGFPSAPYTRTNTNKKLTAKATALANNIDVLLAFLIDTAAFDRFSKGPKEPLLTHFMDRDRF